MNICVFCGSSKGTIPVYTDAAKSLGKLLAAKNITLVYGGGNVGLMGVTADAVMEHGGKVIGIIPEFLVKREVGHRGITQLEVVHSMHERKKRMADLADGFIAMPGGWGTLEELAEILTWRQLALIDQPVGILNTAGFFDPLLQQMHKMTDEGFLKKGWVDMLHVGNSPSELLRYFVG
jgi:uncharacterized protein (TIGR00730 family)